MNDKIFIEKSVAEQLAESYKLLVGWREWAALPELSIPAIKVKIDTGAKTSALHAFDMEIIEDNGKRFINFNIHPLQRNDVISRACCAEIIDERIVKSSNGEKEKRYLIRTKIKMGRISWPINITLTNRDIMNYRMLLGREAMDNIMVDPVKSFYLGRKFGRKIRSLYK